MEDYRVFNGPKGRTGFFMPDAYIPELRGESLAQIHGTMLRHEQVPAVANPDQSGYHVNFYARADRDVMGQRVHYFPGGNAETSANDTLIHGETSALDGALAHGMRGYVTNLVLRDMFDNDSPEGLMVRCCGGCRDKLLTYLPLDFPLASFNDRYLMVHSLGALTFEDLAPISQDELTDAIPGYHAASFAGLMAREDAIDAYATEGTPLEHLNSAVLLGSRGANRLIAETWSSGFYTNAGYARSYATEIADAMLRNDAFTVGVWDLEAIVYTAFMKDGEYPSMPYRDRQAALELDDIIRRITGRDTPLPVIVNSYGIDEDTTYPAGSWITNTEEWLPFPFRPSEFGMDEALDQQADKIRKIFVPR